MRFTRFVIVSLIAAGGGCATLLGIDDVGYSVPMTGAFEAGIEDVSAVDASDVRDAGFVLPWCADASNEVRFEAPLGSRLLAQRLLFNLTSDTLV